MELKKGTSLLGGKYRIERTLGQGSFGITYLAQATLTVQGALGSIEIENQVAIKEFFMSDVNSRCNGGTAVEGSTGSVFTNYRKKFKKEAQNLASLSHPNIVKVLDVFDENNTTYYVMEFIEGENLDDYIKRKGHLSEKEAIAITKEIGSALSYMHSCNMLHLDIKPKNIMRKADGVCRLIDFGLSKQFNDNGEPESSTTIGLGTPGYAPIEQASHKQSGTFPATLDVYALGATVYKMLTGKRPPEAAAIIEDGFPREELEALGISQRMISANEKAMAPSRKSRYQTIAAYLAALTDNEETTTIATPEEETTTIDATIDKEEIDMASIWESHSEPIQNPKPDFRPSPKPKPTVVIKRDEEASKSKFGLILGIFVVVFIIFTIILATGGSETKEAWADSESVVAETFVEETVAWDSAYYDDYYDVEPSDSAKS
ncbi:MAG: serine/threonine protein kinase [Lepagella sp.]